ncbi:MAG: hypothetical protein IBX68_04570 [Dehalococcoidia bacterium]|nr:hypothetical protein [Dehalococcoidia bacterium]
MLEKLGDFLFVLVTPLTEAGNLLAQNASTAATTLGTQDRTLMYTWFLSLGGPFIDRSGEMLTASGEFVLAVSNFLVSLAALL